MSGPKDRIREWFFERNLIEKADEVVITGLTDYPEPMLQVEHRARAAFWPRAMFEQQWPEADGQLHRFFVVLAAKERGEPLDALDQLREAIPLVPPKDGFFGEPR